MNNILKDFLETEVFKKLEEINDVICVLIGGSIAFGIVDERTDYDIIIYTKGKPNNLNNYYDRHYMIHNNGSKLHWYIQGDEILQVPKHGLWWVMAMHSHQQNQVWIKNQEEYQKTKEKNWERLLQSFKLEIETENSLLYKFKDVEKITENFYSKDIYRWLTCWYWIKHGSLTEKQITWLKTLKRIRWIESFGQKFTKELQDTLIELKEAIAYLEKL